MVGLDMSTLTQGVSLAPRYRQAGKLRSATGVLTCAMSAAVGDQCEIQIPGRKSVLTEVIGFEGNLAYMVPFDAADDLSTGMMVVRKGRNQAIPTGVGLLGRVIDGLGRPIDNKGPLLGCPLKPINRPAPPAMERQRITAPFVTGVRAIDGLLTCGRGQRIGIFAGSGVGKSTLLGEIARGAESDVNVIALVGERGLEVIPFIEDSLGAEGLARSVVVVATGEQTPLMRVRATQAAIAIADHFRDEGKNVLFMADSLTRLAIAQRDLGQMRGEVPSSKGYTTSVFSELSNTIERLGNSANGSITALLTVLVEGGDMEEPIADAVRSFVDGHIVLTRKIATSGRYPAIDVSQSVSRVATYVADKEHLVAMRKFRAVLSTLEDIEDLVRIGAYIRGTSPEIDRALDLKPVLNKFLSQEKGERISFQQSRTELLNIAKQWVF